MEASFVPNFVAPLEYVDFSWAHAVYMRNSLLRPQIARNHPKTQIFLKTRRCHEIPQELPLNSH